MSEEEKVGLEVYDTVPYEELKSEKKDKIEFEKKAKKGFLASLGDKIKNKLDDAAKTRNERTQEKKELDDYNRKIMLEVKKEAIKEAMPELKKKLKEQEVERLTKPKKNILQTIGAEFQHIGSVNTDEKLRNMLGTGRTTNMSEKMLGSKSTSNLMGSVNINEDKIKDMISLKKTSKRSLAEDGKKINDMDVEAKLKKALGK